MKTLLHTISTLIFCCTCIIASAQPPVHFYSLTEEDGLSNNMVYDMLQDHNGFLWIATHYGLDRYDGYHFRHYRYDPHDINSISGNFVHCVKEDSNGILWLTNNNGLNSLNPLTGEVKRFVPTPATMPKDMGDLLLLNDSLIVVTAISAVYAFNTHRQSFTEIELPRFQYGPNLVNAKFITGYRGMILLCRGNNHNECLSIDWKHNTTSFFPILDKLNVPAGGKELFNLYFDSKGNPWCFSTGKDLLLTKKISGKAIHYPFGNDDVHGLENKITGFLEEQDKLWMCTEAGLVYYDYNQSVFFRYKEQPGTPASLDDNRIKCMIKDRKGLCWVGTFGGGICYFRMNDDFKNIVMDTGYNNNDRKIYGFQSLHSGRIIVGTMSGRKFMLGKDKSIHVLDYKKDFKTPALFDDLIEEFTGKPVQSFSATNLTALQHYFQSVFSGNPSRQMVTADALKNALRSGRILSIGQNNVWINFFDKHLDDGVSSHQYKQEVYDFQVLASNHFLFATNNGLLEFDANTDQVVKTWLPEPGNPNSIGSSGITCLSPDGKGNYWIGTTDAGLDFWDVKTGKFYHYTTTEGLPDNKIYCILHDKHGRLWMSTDSGLSCFDTAARTFTNFSRDDGLINKEYNSGSACIGKDGWFYFGGMNGVDYFHPDSINLQKDIPQLMLASFKVYDKEMPLTGEYKLPTNDNNIQLAFTANDFGASSKLLYRYQLNDVDKDWVDARGNNFALYNKLPPGDYEFKVMASWDGQAWSKPLVVAVSIATPWFQSWWFYALLILAAVTGIYVFFNYRLRQQLKLFQVRNRISRDLHDDVGATLSSVKAYSEILKGNPDNPLIVELIKENAAEMIDRLEVIAWATNPHHDSFESLYNKIQRYAAPLCMAKNIAFEFDSDGIAKETEVPGEVRQNIFLVCKEAVNNSIKYAAPKNIFISTVIEGGKFTMQIRDDGNGFDTATESDGNGLKNMQTRINDVGGNINIKSKTDSGTAIKIQLSYPFKIPNIKAGNDSR